MGTLKDLLDLFDRVNPGADAVARAIRFYRSSYFFAEPLVKYLLWSRDLQALPRTEFIDYSAYTKYYPGAAHTMDYSRLGERRPARLPYTLEVDFIAEPHASIHVDSMGPYSMPDEWQARTEYNLRRYKEKKPTTTDGPILRMARLDRIADGQYVCRLETSSYWYQARTNLTIDLPLEEDSLQTLRILDLGSGRTLRPLYESVLVNSIGVSAVVYQTTSEGREIFVKLRKQREGVFEEMLGTTSGVVTVPAGARIPELLSYATTEMVREFSRETGLELDKVPLKRITPLAFTRELCRGGKPQFFFLIEVPQLEKATFKALFKASPEGLDEFADHLLSGVTDYHRALSPEFAANLALAFRYFQAREGLSDSPLNLA